MPWTTQQIIDEVDERYPNALSSTSKIRKIYARRCELFRTIFRKETSTTYNLVNGTAYYPLDFDISKITSVLVNGVEYDSEEIEDRDAESPYWYRYENSIGIYPTPTANVTAGLLIVHFLEPAPITNVDAYTDFDPDFPMIEVYGLCVDMAEIDQRYDLVNGFTMKYNGLLRDYKNANPAPELPPVKVR